jgi:hypothetical protein
VKKSFKSPEKAVTWDEATKLYTVVAPFGPEYSFHDTPLIVGVATGEPVEEIGPAPPRAANQTIISNSLLPVAVELVKISYETSATIEVPV